ncbi:hypothetical protein HYU06_04205 [Candidatus Woesearchaeota archaeon]|nr:hypothetical protein [Candidatus Woesearchaeota archaeon]
MASAALIGGRVYDYSLNSISNVNVEINTTPKQREVADQSVYVFNVPKGSYVIIAKQYEDGILKASTTEQITVDQEGEYKLDLILFPDVSEDQNLIDEKIELKTPYDDEKKDNILLVVAILAVIVITAVISLLLNKKRKNFAKPKKKTDVKKVAEEVIKETANEKVIDELPAQTEDADAKMVLEFIKAGGGRTTQKDIRKSFPSSEAKISLILTDLEAQGKIRKIKKGRGNVVVMK